MADFPGSDDRGTPLNGNQSAFGVNGRALDAPAAEVAALFAAEGERAVAYLCTSARPMTFADADALVERAFAQTRERWSESRRLSRPAIFAFVILQQVLSAHRSSGADPASDAVAQSTAASAGRVEIPRLVALQNALDQLPPQQ